MRSDALTSTLHDIADPEDERTIIESIPPNHLVMPRVDLAVIMGALRGCRRGRRGGRRHRRLPA